MLIDAPCFLRLVGIDEVSGRIIDENTILNFRKLLEEYGNGDQIFETVKVTRKAPCCRRGRFWMPRSATPPVPT